MDCAGGSVERRFCRRMTKRGFARVAVKTRAWDELQARGRRLDQRPLHGGEARAGAGIGAPATVGSPM